MASPDRHFATAAIFTHSTGLTPNSGDAALYIKSDNKAYIKDSTGAEAAVGAIGGTSGTIDNAIVRADGTGGATVQSSDINVDDATTSTSNNVAITNQHAGQTNSSFVLTPKGTGAFILGPKPDGTATGGNARGGNAIDLQTKRTANTQVASSLDSFAFGASNTASNTNATAIGTSNTASGLFSTAIGRSCSASNSNANSFGIFCISSANPSTSFGIRSVADRYGMFSEASDQFAIAGDAQRARFVLRCKTTTNAAVEMALDGGTTYLGIPSGKVMFMNIKVVGTKSDGTAIATYERQYAVKNVTGTSSEIYAAVVIGTDNAAGTSLAVATVDAGDYVSIKPTGITAETWRWVASVDAVEVAYGT